MDKEMSEIIEGLIERKLQDKADGLGIEFKVKHSVKEYMDDVLLRIKRLPSPTEDSTDEEIKIYKEEISRHREFTEFASDIVVGKYSNHIRFTYPTKL
jgi:hypothetical protein